ncbi:hypothetical protein SDC9_144371 [bioreactor metagenome]|uniref:Uncharacterized protein n=1 Tax=bioreactor metagenome TaxID=1076179 RepID=A0A645E7J5_9ZZZZ|nr:hypothetical protein [Candidatus Metalachnospira sp.]
MNNKPIALMGIIFGSLFLSFEIYMLKIVQYLDKSGGSWFENVWEYAKMFPCNIALFITIAVVIFSFFIFFRNK